MAKVLGSYEGIAGSSGDWGKGSVEVCESLDCFSTLWLDGFSKCHVHIFLCFQGAGVKADI